MDKKQTAMVRRTVTNQLTNRAIFPDTLDGLLTFCRVLVQSGYIPQQHQARDFDTTVARVVMVAQMGASVGMDPATSLRSIDNIKGKLEFSSKAKLALAQRSPDWEWISYEKDREAKAVTVRVKRRGFPVHEETYSHEDAVAAGTARKDNYGKHLYRMLMHRARTYALDDIFGDATGAVSGTSEDMLMAHGESLEPDPSDPGEQALDAEYEEIPHNPETGEVAPQEPPAPEPEPEQGVEGTNASEAKIAFLVAFQEAKTRDDLLKAKEDTKQEHPFTKLPQVTQQEIVAAYKLRHSQLGE